MDILDKIAIKETFVFSKDIYMKLNRKKLIRKLIVVIIAIVIAISVFIMTNWLKINNNVILYSSIFWISVFLSLFQIGSIYSIPHNRPLYISECYLITEDDRLFLIEFVKEECIPAISTGIIDSIRQMLSYKEKSTTQTKKDISNLLVDDNILKIYEILNVYRMTKQYNAIEINCDYIEWTENKVYENDTQIFSKYINDFDKILIQVKRLSQNRKSLSSYKKDREVKLTDDQIKLLNKISLGGYVLVPIISLINGDSIRTVLSSSTLLVIPFLIFMICYKNHEINEITHEEQKMWLRKGIQRDKMVLIIYIALIIVGTILFEKNVITALGSLCVFLLLIFIIVCYIRKKQK